MVSFVWHNGEVPKNLQVRQVYGVIFTKDGRTLLKIEKNEDKDIYSLAGGKPEVYDKDRVATLRRELLEEINTEVEDEVKLVGYQTVNGDGDKPEYAQVRMTAIIKNIGEKLPDVDNGQTYDRLLTSPENAIKLLNWNNGEELINEACKIAKENFDIKFNCLEDEYV